MTSSMAEKMMNNISSYDQQQSLEQQTKPSSIHTQNKLLTQPQINVNEIQKFSFKNSINNNVCK
jgi:hypothetical protein